MSPAFATSTLSSISVRCQLGEYLNVIESPSRSALAPNDGSRVLSMEIRSGASNLVALSMSFVLIPAIISATSAFICEDMADRDCGWWVEACAGAHDNN